MKSKLFNHLPFLLLLGLVLLGCEKEQPETKPIFSLEQADQLTDEEYNIYSIVINKLYFSDKVVISQSTITYLELFYKSEFYNELTTNHQNFDTSLVQTHLDLNSNSIHFGAQFQDETIEIILISNDELNYIFTNQNNDVYEGWLTFYDCYPYSNGIINFSRIAINDEKTQAIFEIGHQSAGLSGYGSIIFLEKANNIWTIKEIINTWIS